jgi:hypothetical protein
LKTPLARNKRLVLAITGIIVVVSILSAFIMASNYKLSLSKGDNKPSSVSTPFYIGVTYCGNSVTEAKQLIDKVKNYTNLFVIQSGPLISRQDATQEICDYAVNAGLNIILYYSNNGLVGTYLPLINNAEARWGSKFIGIYYDDEPGGKMLDGSVMLYDNITGKTVNKDKDGLQVSYFSRESNKMTLYNYKFSSSGEIIVYISTTYPDRSSQSNMTTYFTNGTISFSTVMSANGTVTPEEPLWYYPSGIVKNKSGVIATGKGDISQFAPYSQVWNLRPLQTYTETANLYANARYHVLSNIGNQSNIKLFTADYGLYWFDYKAGYDTVFAELGWNNNPAQEIALVRGAANMQNKEWGTMITWQSNNAPYLQSGSQIYDEMRLSYQSGAKYVIVFNYTPDDNPLGIAGNGTRVENGVGLLQGEHFAAIQRFWTEIVHAKETNNIAAEAALVLPKDYGWGMRNRYDTIWGLWKTDNNSEKIWAQLQNKLAQYGSKLDIVYDDPAYPLSGKYSQIYYWNQTE